GRAVRAQAMNDDVGVLLELVGDVRTLAVVEPENLLLLARCGHAHPVDRSMAPRARSPGGDRGGASARQVCRTRPTASNRCHALTGSPRARCDARGTASRSRPRRDPTVTPA